MCLLWYHYRVTDNRQMVRRRAIKIEKAVAGFREVDKKGMRVYISGFHSLQPCRDDTFFNSLFISIDADTVTS